MKKYTQILVALAMAGAMTQLPACGDDKPGKSNGGGDGDSADAGDGDGDKADGGDGDTTNPDGGAGNDDAGNVVTVKECPKDSHIEDDAENKVCKISAPKGSEITSDLTLSPVEGYKGYVLEGVVYVGEDVGGAQTPAAGKKTATLTIEPGTQIAGLDQTSGLAINRGSKLDAQGTKDAPIVFTSLNAMLDTGTDPAPTDWGGIVLMGRAKQNKGPDPVTELDTGTYGGEIDDDNSGSLKYVRVEFSGARSSTEKEFNGITFYAVGSKTTVDYVQIHAGSDDGVEFFGGSVNAKHLVISGGGDDGIDWTDGFRGKIQFAVVKQVPNFGDNGIEADNQKSDNAATPVSEPTLSNLTFLGQTSAPGESGPNGFLLRAGTKVHIHSALATNFKNSCVNVDGAASQAFVGTADLTMTSSRIFCSNNYLGEGEALFTGDASNSVLSSADVLDGFLPKASSNLLTGGSVPSDSFFEQVDYIGAFGTEDWTAGWTKFPDFSPM